MARETDIVAEDFEPAKRRKSTSPTQRTLLYLRDHGYSAGIVERWNPWGQVRQDLFGFIDLVAIKPNTGIIGIQTTSAENHAARLKKAARIPSLKTWIASGAIFEVWSWGKRGKGSIKRWTLRRERVTLSNGQLYVSTILNKKRF